MNSIQLFQMALGIDSPWEIKKINFINNNTDLQELHIDIDFKSGSKFPDENGKLCSIHDTKKKTWRHLNFFQHSCYLHCRVPRIKCNDGCVKLIAVPWARPGSGFTLLFEAYAMALIEKEMPIKKVGELLSENPHRVWTIFNYWIKKAYAADDVTTIKDLGLDETSLRKGHDYITVAVDLEKRRVFHVAEGKDKKAVETVQKYLENKGTDANKIKRASMDMSPSYISGVKTHFPNAEIHFDRFHVVKLLNEAMDEVRKQERKEHQELKGHKYTFLKNSDSLSASKKSSLNELIKLFPTLGEAYRLKEVFNDLWDMDSEKDATAFLVEWCKEVDDKGITPFQNFVKTIKAHWSGIVNFCETGINNGILEGINSKIQLAKRRARGYRCNKNFINMIYFMCGKLKFDYPLYST